MTDIDADFGALATKLRASTVRVVDERGRGAGSGIVWNTDGLVLTNAHVVAASSALVESAGGASARARVVRRDPARDLAALQVDDFQALVPAEIRDSNSLAVGELVFAAGNPLGFVGAVTAGLVHRSGSRWVVADVRLAPGNSGGPLADAQGRVVGINSMVARGLALAVPTAEVAAFLGSATERRLGVTLVRVGAREGGRRITALLITAIEPGSVAERSGLLLGDALVGTKDPRRETTLDVVRGGQRLRIALAWPEDARAA